MYELIDKQSGETVLESSSPASLQAQADPRHYVILNADTGVVWDDWYFQSDDDEWPGHCLP